MAFKEQLAKDLEIFINAEEFAAEHNLNGTTCLAVVEGPDARERFINSEPYNGYSGIYGSSVTVHCKTDVLDELPVQGQRFDLDDTIYIVASCVEEMGVVTVTLQAEMR